MQDARKIFSDYLKKKELKNTSERFTVLDEIIRSRRHFEADALLIQLKKKHKKISRATIYRTLDLLVTSGLVKKINFAAAHAYYEPVAGITRHDHFICEQCGKIIEFYDPAINKIHQRLEVDHGLDVYHYTYHLYGCCPACKNKKGKDG